MRKYIGFTLAEVLITLGIIGIISAMTIPTLIQKYKERVTVNKVKNMYATFSQALKLAIAENGEVDGWDYTATRTEQGASSFAKYLKPYFKIALDCGKNITGVCNMKQTFALNGDSWNYYNGTEYYKLILNDGSKIWFRINGTGACKEPDRKIQNVCALIWYDVDGTKEKNIIGKDIFVFFIMKDKIMLDQNQDCNLSDWGIGCSKYIVENGNMNYLKK
jgi:prepilin-type N-terminal cleavage/methylation domain-containing protein